MRDRTGCIERGKLGKRALGATADLLATPNRWPHMCVLIYFIYMLRFGVRWLLLLGDKITQKITPKIIQNDDIHLHKAILELSTNGLNIY